MATHKLINITTINPRYQRGNVLDSEAAVSFIPMAAVSEKTRSIVAEQERSLTEVSNGFTYFQNEDVLVAKITPCFENGKMALVKISNEHGFGSTEFHVIRPQKNLLNSKYLFHFLQQDSIRYEGEKRMAGSAGQKRVPKTFFENLEIPLPPLDEQKRIAAVLDKADEVRQKRRQSIQKLDALLESVFLDMFGDPVSNPKGWDIKSISEIAEVGTGSTPNRLEEDNYGDFISWVKTTEINGGVISKTDECLSEKGLKISRCKIFPPKSLLMAMYGQGATRGKIAMLSIEATTNQACAVIMPNQKYVTEFLFALLKMQYQNLRDLGRGGNQPNLNLSLVKNFSVISPPIELQHTFAKIFKNIETQKSQQKVFKMNINNLFQSLQQRAFAGELFAAKELENVVQAI